MAESLEQALEGALYDAMMTTLRDYGINAPYQNSEDEESEEERR